MWVELEVCRGNGGHSVRTVYDEDGAGWHALMVDSNTRMAADGIGVAASGLAAER